VDGLGPEDVVTIEFPMVESTETYLVRDVKYTCHLKGNTLVDISPRAVAPTAYPTYQRDAFKEAKAPMRAAKRYVAPLTIRW
jgi:hypothetical protein